MSNRLSLRRSPEKFFLLTFALTAPIWLVGILARRLSIGLPFNLPISIFGILCPLIAALILVGREEGRSGIRRLLRRILDRSGIAPKVWYAPIILLLPLIYLLSYIVMLIMGRSLPEWSFPLLALPVILVFFFVLAAAEEAGWMGYAYDPLQERSNALTAALVLGVVWAAWHIPGDLIANQPLDWIVGQRVYAIALRVLIVWLYSNTGKSILAASIFHGLDNVSFALFPNMGSHYDPAIIATLTAIATVIVTYLWGPQTLARYRFSRPGTLRSTNHEG
jgi:uncharacterized protein